jgi:hypothetical protein
MILLLLSFPSPNFFAFSIHPLALPSFFVGLDRREDANNDVGLACAAVAKEEEDRVATTFYTFCYTFLLAMSVPVSPNYPGP